MKRYTETNPGASIVFSSIELMVEGLDCSSIALWAVGMCMKVEKYGASFSAYVYVYKAYCYKKSDVKFEFSSISLT